MRRSSKSNLNEKIFNYQVHIRIQYLRVSLNEFDDVGIDRKRPSNDRDDTDEVRIHAVILIFNSST